MSGQNKQCPEFPFFGASYPDARCINGYLWDLDKCDENGNLYGEGDIPCPFCNTEKFIEYDPFSKEDEFYEGIENEEKAKEKSREWYLNWINYMREQIICEEKGITWNDLVRIRVIRPKKFLGFFRQLTGITIEGAFNGCSACVEIMADDDNGVSMMHYIDYEDIIGVELIKN